MSIQVQRENTETPIIRMIFEAGWTLEAYYHSIAALEVMLNHVPDAAVVMDMSRTRTTPTMRVTRGRSLDEDRVLCSAGRLVLINGRRFMPQVTCPVEQVDTLEQAYVLIGERLAETA